MDKLPNSNCSEILIPGSDRKAIEFRKLALQAETTAATHSELADKFEARGKNTVAHECRQIARQALDRAKAYRVHADLIERSASLAERQESA